eukprot:gene11665-34378_t
MKTVASRVGKKLAVLSAHYRKEKPAGKEGLVVPPLLDRLAMIEETRAFLRAVQVATLISTRASEADYHFHTFFQLSVPADIHVKSHNIRAGFDRNSEAYVPTRQHIRPFLAFSTTEPDRDVPMAIEAGGRYTLALFTNGKVKRWGATGARLPYSLDYINLGTDCTATAITIGSIHFCIILQDGELKCGENIDPTFVSPATSRSKIAVDMGTFHSCAIIDNGDVKCWGPLSEGSEDDLPTIDLGTNRTATSITLGQYHTCAVLDNGEVKCWGSNAYGQLGQTTASYCNRYYCPNMGDALPAVDLGIGRTATSIAADLGTDRTATAIDAGEFHTCAILDNGNLKCWGHNEVGQLGLGDTVSRGDDAEEMGDNLPAVDLGTGRTATTISSGYQHNCALLDNNAVKCWGWNRDAQLGLGDTVSRGDAVAEMGDNLPALQFNSPSPPPLSPPMPPSPPPSPPFPPLPPSPQYVKPSQSQGECHPPSEQLCIM